MKTHYDAEFDFPSIINMGGDRIDIPCNLCAATSPRFLFDNCSYQIVKCRRCGLAYVNPQPTEEVLKSYYHSKDLMQQKGWSAYFEHSQAQIKDLWEKRIRSLEKWVNESNPSILDIGAGYGDFLYYAKERGWEPVGFDFSPSVSNVSMEKYGIRVETGDLFEMNYGPDAFDIITFWHVLEHMRNPLAVLLRAHSILKPKGILAIEVPNLNFFTRKTYKFPLSITLHLFYFSPATLSALVQKAGFEVLACKQGYTGNLYCNPFKIIAKKMVFAFSSTLEKMTKINVGDSLQVVAQKRK